MFNNEKMVIGLDFETSGVDQTKHVPLTLGLAWAVGDSYETKEIQLNIYDDQTHDWETEALVVNGLDIRKYSYRLKFETPEEAIKDTDYDLFCELTAVTDMQMVPTGWNVYGFDMRFMWHYFPKTNKLFHYSSDYELNTMCRLMDSVNNVKRGSTKKAVKNQASEILNSAFPDIHSLEAHNAKYDALHSLICYEVLYGIYDR